MSKKLFDILRIIQIILPAAGALYGALAMIWGLPYGEQIVSSVAAVEAFLSAILAIESKNYFKDKAITKIVGGE